MSSRKVIILGTRGIPASHGGFETFAEHFALYLAKNDWEITVYCQSSQITSDVKTDEWNGVRRVHLAPILNGKLLKGVAGTILFDLRAILHAMKYSKDAVWLTLGYNTAFLNIMPWLRNIKQIINMDGVEWRRDKWNKFAKIYLYINYKISGWVGNILIADHPVIKKMLEQDFADKKIIMIPYGSNVISNTETALLNDYGLQPEQYLLLIARLEPENNILPVIKAWSAKPRSKKLVIVGDYLSGNAYQQKLRKIASKDVVFTGPIYQRKIVETLRFHCLAYIHGHSVGGTNPTLVESLGAGAAIIAHDNPFNHWVAGHAAVYFKNEDELNVIFDQIDNQHLDLETLKQNARQQHNDNFQWLPVLQQYETVIKSLF